MAASTVSPDERFRELDGLRGIAAVAVVIYHFTDSLSAREIPAPRYLPTLWWGEYGVQLFFLISGFVILMTARRAKVASDFVISRVSRLYPVYWIAVTVSILLGLAFAMPEAEVTWLDRLMNYTMFQRLLLFDNVDPVYWTLAIEMQFYVLIFLLLIATKSRLTDRFMMIVIFGWIVFSLGLALLARPHTLGLDPQNVATPWKMLLNLLLVEYGPFFAAGMMCYLHRQRRTYLLLALLALACVPISAWILRGTEHAAVVAVVTLIFGVVVLRKSTGFLRWRPVQFYGRISYSLYVGHLLAGITIIHYAHPYLGRDLSVLIAFIAVTGIAVIYHRVGEVHLSRRLKEGLLALRTKRRPGTLDPIGQS